MKAIKTASLFIGLGFFAATLASVPLASAGDHKIPDAPAEYQEMKNPHDYTEFDSESISEERFLKKAAKVYKRKCKKCHGSEGDGQGEASAEIQIKPTAFNVPGYLASRSDGQLLWITKYGSPDTEMKPFGPDSEQVKYSDEELWAVITVMRIKFTK